jgi:hypothetical protein
MIKNKCVDDERRKAKTSYTFAELREYMNELERRETRVVHVRSDRRELKRPYK